MSVPARRAPCASTRPPPRRPPSEQCRRLAAALLGHRRTAISLLALPAGILAFFRDPDRTPDHRQPDPDVVLAPADGRVMYVGPGQAGVAPAGDWQQVSIFLSLFDVHVNRTPAAGRSSR